MEKFKRTMVEEGMGAHTILEMAANSSVIVEGGAWSGEIRRRESKIPFPKKWWGLDWSALTTRREIVNWYRVHKSLC